MGSAEARSFSRGKRGISGTMVFTVFDRDALIAELKDEVYASSTPLTKYDPSNVEKIRTIEEWDNDLTNLANSVTGSNVQKTADLRAGAMAGAAKILYADEIPPFDITISFVNEMGARAALVLYGVEILNEGSSFSIDNIISEKVCTFIARRVSYLHAVDASGKEVV